MANLWSHISEGWFRKQGSSTLAKVDLIVLITGGSGRVGRHVVREFEVHGYEVVNLDLKPASRVKTIQADVTDLNELLAVPGHFDAIVHLAAIPELAIPVATRCAQH